MTSALLRPPYQWGYTWLSQDGDTYLNRANFYADNHSGFMRSNAGAYGDSGGTIQANTSLGFYWAPGDYGVNNGILILQTAPPFNYNWFAGSGYGGSAWAAAWAGFLVNRFDLSGNYIDSPIDQASMLWDQENGQNGGYSGGNPWSASLIVDDASYYNVWVRMITYASNSGLGTFSYGTADSFLNMYVPSIHWSLET